MDPNKKKAYETAKQAGYSPSEIDAYLLAKGKDLNQYRDTTGRKIVRGVANALPGVMGAVGGLTGGIAGSVIAPGAGTIAAGAAGVGVGAGAGEATKQSILGLLDNKRVQKTGTTFEERMQPASVLQSPQISSAMTGPVAGVETYATGKALEAGGKLIKGTVNKVASLEPSKVLGQKAKNIASNVKASVLPEKVMNRATEILDEQKIVGSTKEKALAELSRISPDAPTNVIDTLLGRRGVDKQIVRNIFGQPKSGVGKNVGLNAYRQALDEIVKSIPELKKIDRQLTTYYKIKDPIFSIMTNKLLQGVGGTAIILKLLGGK